MICTKRYSTGYFKIKVYLTPSHVMCRWMVRKVRARLEVDGSNPGLRKCAYICQKNSIYLGRIIFVKKFYLGRIVLIFVKKILSR